MCTEMHGAKIRIIYEFAKKSGKKFGVGVKNVYICNVKGEAKESHDVRNGGMATGKIPVEMMSNSTLPLGFFHYHKLAVMASFFISSDTSAV